MRKLLLKGLPLKILRRRTLAEDLETELAFHREMAAAHDNPIGLGNVAVINEHAFDLWRFGFLENVWRDLQYAARSLSRSPGFVLSAPSVADASSWVSIYLGDSNHANQEAIDCAMSNSPRRVATPV